MISTLPPTTDLHAALQRMYRAYTSKPYARLSSTARNLSVARGLRPNKQCCMKRYLFLNTNGVTLWCSRTNLPTLVSRKCGYPDKPSPGSELHLQK